MAEMQYVSNERFEEYRKSVNQHVDDVSKLIKYELGNRLEDLRREVIHSRKDRILFTMAYLGVGVWIAAIILILTAP